VTDFFTWLGAQSWIGIVMQFICYAAWYHIGRYRGWRVGMQTAESLLNRAMSVMTRQHRAMVNMSAHMDNLRYRIKEAKNDGK
jgi:hypothetical protein